MPTIIGTSRSPAWVGVACVVVWRYRGTNTVIENSAAVVRNSATLETATGRMRSRFSGTIGSATRRSRATSATASAAPPAISAMIVAEPHAYRSPPQMHASISAIVEPASRPAPARSRCFAGWCAGSGAGSLKYSPASATAPTGRLT